MRQQSTVFAITLLAVMTPIAAMAQQAPAAPRPAAVIDAGAIRKQAAQMAEVRGLLSDPDANVRLLAIREIAKSGDPIQRQLAIETGLTSAEAAMQEAALRAVVADTTQIIIPISAIDGKPITDGQASVHLTVTKFDPDTGRISGPGWSGQIQGAVFAFSTDNGSHTGSLAWDTEAGEFRGMLNNNFGNANGARKAVWRPR